MSENPHDRENLLAVNLSLAANAVLAVLKTAVGIVGHSPALLADGINSTSDVAYLVIVRVFMGLAGKPPDKEHPFGHRQLESIAAVVVGAFVVTTAVAIFWDAINQVYDLLTGQRQFAGATSAALWVALLTVVVKVVLTVFTSRVGRRTSSIAVLAVARDHRNDIFSIAAAALGILIGQTGPSWVDPAAAALVAMVILHTGVTILRESSADLMDILPREPIVGRIRQWLTVVPGVEQVEEIHAHRIGLYLHVDVTIGVDGTLTVAAGDQIASDVERVLRRNIEYLRHVTIHYHPSKM
ncbi:MAG: cation transporter [Pirellulales bacterium]|nr:cation transporter [Pirellulales bacterium]